MACEDAASCHRHCDQPRQQLLESEGQVVSDPDALLPLLWVETRAQGVIAGADSAQDSRSCALLHLVQALVKLLDHLVGDGVVLSVKHQVEDVIVPDEADLFRACFGEDLIDRLELSLGLRQWWEFFHL